jgi:hypothetical protein
MEGLPAGRAWIEIARPLTAVQAHFFDLAGMIATQPHHGAVLSWALPDGAGRGRARQTLRVMDHLVVDDFVLETGADGRWIKRFVEGPNAGGRYVAAFAPSDDGRTRVDIEAFGPKGGFAFGVGRLSPLGVEKALKKLLEEHKKAIESFEYVPGSLRSPVARAVESLRDLVAPIAARADRDRSAAVATILESASVVILADSAADEAELEVLDEAARVLCDAQLDEGVRGAIVRGAARTIGDQGIAARCEALGARLARLDCAEAGLAFAILVADASHGIDPHELAAIERLASGSGMSGQALVDLMSRVDVAMRGGGPLAPPKIAA